MVAYHAGDNVKLVPMDAKYLRVSHYVPSMLLVVRPAYKHPYIMEERRHLKEHPFPPVHAVFMGEGVKYLKA